MLLLVRFLRFMLILHYILAANATHSNQYKNAQTHTQTHTHSHTPSSVDHSIYIIIFLLIIICLHLAADFHFH